MLVLLNNTLFDNSFIKSNYITTNNNTQPDINNIVLKVQSVTDHAYQTVVIDDIAVVCIGEIYNSAELYEILDIEPSLDSKYEILIHVYKRYGLDYLLQVVDGTFTFFLFDYRISNKTSKLYVVRDLFGVYPLYMLNFNKDFYTFAKNIKMLQIYEGICEQSDHIPIRMLTPATYSIFELSNLIMPKWSLIEENKQYYHRGGGGGLRRIASNQDYNPIVIYQNIQTRLVQTIEKLIINKPICILNGQLGNYIIAGVLSDICLKNDQPKLRTYSVGFIDSDMLKETRNFANYIGSEHTEYIISQHEVCDELHDIIYNIETFDVATIDASIELYLLLKNLARDNICGTVFDGFGFNELVGEKFGGTDDFLQFDQKCLETLENMYRRELLGVSKSFLHFGLTPCLPYLDRSFVEYYMSIPPEFRFYHDAQHGISAYLIRNAFSSDINSIYDPTKEIIPKDFLWRKTQVFEQTTKIHEITDVYAATTIPDTFDSSAFAYHLKPETTKDILYRRMFEYDFENYGKIVCPTP